jgi:Domain of unknown function (DUF4124)
MKTSHILAVIVTLTGALATSLIASPAFAAKTVYRCEDGGKTVYSDDACASAQKSRKVNVDDKRTPAERAAAIAAVKRNTDLNRQSARERLAADRINVKREAAMAAKARRDAAKKASASKPKRVIKAQKMRTAG